jgi:hypothetical protein
VAEWADHSVEMLLSTYAKCIDGPDQDARTRNPGRIAAETRTGIGREG